MSFLVNVSVFQQMFWFHAPLLYLPDGVFHRAVLGKLFGKRQVIGWTITGWLQPIRSTVAERYQKPLDESNSYWSKLGKEEKIYSIRRKASVVQTTAVQTQVHKPDVSQDGSKSSDHTVLWMMARNSRTLVIAIRWYAQCQCCFQKHITHPANT